MEVERKYAVDPGWQMPDLAQVSLASAVSGPTQVTLEATYFDTSDLALLRSRCTLRRRTGGSDEGWHLKVPAGTDRLEIRLGLGRAVRTVPRRLRDLTRARRRDADLLPVVRLVTQRTVRVLSDATGAAQAEVTDDRVTAHLAATGAGSVDVLEWREVEVELADAASDGESLLDEIESLLLASGAEPSRWASKLGRAMADRLPDDDDLPGPGPTSPAGDVVVAFLAAQVEQITDRDPAVRRDQPDAVHKMRVATRRMRSALVTFRPLLDSDVTEPLRAELTWLAGVLGAARDAEVMRDRVVALARDEPPDLLLGPVVQRLDDELSTAYRQALAAVHEVLDGERYLQLLCDLDDLLRDPPLTATGRRPAAKVLPARVRKDWRRLRRRVEEATAETGTYSLHDARKAAKRARYAAEVATSALGSEAGAFAEAMEQLQEVLGEHQDALTAQQLLRRVGVEAHLAGENGFSFGRLHALEQARGQAALGTFTQTWPHASRKALRRWW